jgi:pyridoxal phosphate enzyme (YggS family)
MSAVTEALQGIRARIDTAARAAGRDPATVKLVAVSKRQPEAKLREAYAAGQRDFGENYSQELAEKAATLRDLPDLTWHFIGHLQSNKAKLVAPTAALIHAVDKADLAEALVRKAGGRPLRCLIEVNVGLEAQKHGVLPDQVAALASRLSAMPGLTLEGLMCLPPAGQPAGPFFTALHGLRDTLRAQLGLPLPELSMGMSEDFELAIAAGATLVRVGTAIFGERSA